MDEELDRLKAVGLPSDKEHWNIEDLNGYITALKAEIDIVEQIVSEKTKVQMAANALFGMPADQFFWNILAYYLRGRGSGIIQSGMASDAGLPFTASPPLLSFPVSRMA